MSEVSEIAGVRSCDRCKAKVPPGVYRRQQDDGQMLCPGCHGGGDGMVSATRMAGYEDDRYDLSGSELWSADQEADWVARQHVRRDQKDHAYDRGRVDGEAGLSWQRPNEYRDEPELMRQYEMGYADGESDRAYLARSRYVTSSRRRWARRTPVAFARVAAPPPWLKNRDKKNKKKPTNEKSPSPSPFSGPGQDSLDDGSMDGEPSLGGVPKRQITPNRSGGDPGDIGGRGGEMGGRSRARGLAGVGEQKPVFACPFCGSQGIVGRSNGTIQCDWCKSSFSVIVESDEPFMPMVNPNTGDPVHPDLLNDMGFGEGTQDGTENGSQSPPPFGDNGSEDPESGQPPGQTEDKKKPKSKVPPQFQKKQQRTAASETCANPECKHSVNMHHRTTADGPDRCDGTFKVPGGGRTGPGQCPCTEYVPRPTRTKKSERLYINAQGVAVPFDDFIDGLAVTADRPFYDVFTKMAAISPEDFQKRIDALEPYTVNPNRGPGMDYGPQYSRDVNEPVRDALREFKRSTPDMRGAEYWLLMAEMRGGVISWDEYQEAVRRLNTPEGDTIPMV